MTPEVLGQRNEPMPVAIQLGCGVVPVRMTKHAVAERLVERIDFRSEPSSGQGKKHIVAGHGLDEIPFGVAQQLLTE